MKTVTVENPAGLPTLSMEVLKSDYDWNLLKEKKNRDVGDLKKSILTLGFKVPIFVWEAGKYVTDGTGRLVALDMLAYEGYDIPAIPYVPIEAKDLKEAKRLTLAISSQYGKVTEESAADFMLDMDEIDLSFINLPDLNLEEIDWSPKQQAEKPQKKERGVAKSKLMHTCPKCFHEFSSSEE